MTQAKNKILKIVVLVVIAVTVASFSKRPFAFDGGTIINPNIVVSLNTTPQIIATKATGCGGTISYQWQQSYDGNNFIDMPNATDTSCQAGPLVMQTLFRRRAICSGDTAYTNNVATVFIQ